MDELCLANEDSGKNRRCLRSFLRTALDTQTIEKYLDKLEAKTTVGELLAVKAQAQGLKLVDIPEADEIYTREWALNTAAVTKLLLGA